MKDNVQASSNGVESVSDGVSRLNIVDDVDMDSKAEPTVEHQLVVGVKECKCGMPLCICEAPAPSVDVVPSQVYIFLSSWIISLPCMHLIDLISFVCRVNLLPPLFLSQIQNRRKQKLF